MIEERLLSFWSLEGVERGCRERIFARLTPDRLLCLPPMSGRSNTSGDGLGGRTSA